MFVDLFRLTALDGTAEPEWIIHCNGSSVFQFGTPSDCMSHVYLYKCKICIVVLVLSLYYQETEVQVKHSFIEVGKQIRISKQAEFRRLTNNVN